LFRLKDDTTLGISDRYSLILPVGLSGLVDLSVSGLIQNFQSAEKYERVLRICADKIASSL